jgi:hypothetical protein
VLTPLLHPASASAAQAATIQRQRTIRLLSPRRASWCGRFL